MSEAQILDATGAPMRHPALDHRVARPSAGIDSRDLWRGRGGGHAYSAARQGSGVFEFWRPKLNSATAEVLRDGPDLRARARDLERNHPFARQAVRTSRLGVIGAHLRYSCRPDWRFLGIDQDEAIRWAAEWERVWETYAHGPGHWVDAGRRMTFTQLACLAHDADFVDGEYLLSAEWRPAGRWNTGFQLVDVDRLSNPHGSTETRYLRGGIELGQFGEPLAYHIRDGHPGDLVVDDGQQFRWSRVDKETAWGRAIVLHGFDAQRAGQIRGRSELASVIEALKMGSEYVQTAMQTAILQASYAAVIESQHSYNDAMEAIGQSPEASNIGSDTILDLAEQHLAASTTWHEEINLRFNGAKIPKLYPQEKLHIVNGGSGAASLGEFQAHQTKAYAAGLGVDPIGVSQDYSGVNYSSAKMAAATSYRGYMTKRERMSRNLFMPMVGCALEEAVFAGAVRMPKGLSEADFYAAKDALIAGVFLAQGAPNLDPMKEAQALEIRMRLGLDTLQDACAAEGRDWRDVMDQRRREIDAQAEMGLADPMMMPPPPLEGDSDGGADPGDAEGEDGAEA